MFNSTKQFNCQDCLHNLPAYLDYIIQGTSFSGWAAQEDHLSICPSCATAYSDLLGMILREEMEGFQDILMENVSLDEDNIINVNLFLELNNHWLELSDILTDHMSAAEAHSHLGILYEMKYDYSTGADHHRKALEAAEEYQNHYLGTRSAAGMGRISLRQGKWKEAARYFKLSYQEALTGGDEFAQVRALVALGDYYQLSNRPANLVMGLRQYHQATEKAEQVDYLKAVEIVRARQKQRQELYTDYLRNITSEFVARLFPKEQPLFNQFCQDFVEQFLNTLQGGELKPQLAATGRLFFGGIGGGIKTPIVLAASLMALDEAANWQSGDAELEGMMVPELPEDALTKFIREARSMGLNRREAKKLAEYLQEILIKQKDGLAEPPIE